MTKLLRKGKQQPIDQASCGSRAKHRTFTGQPAEQIPYEGRIPPLTLAKDTSLVSEAVKLTLLAISDQKLGEKERVLNIFVHVLCKNKKICISASNNSTIIEFEVLLNHTLVQDPSKRTFRFTF